MNKENHFFNFGLIHFINVIHPQLNKKRWMGKNIKKNDNEQGLRPTINELLIN